MKITSKRMLVAAALVFAVGVSSALAQEKKDLTLDDVIAGGKGYAEKAPRMLQVTSVTDLGAVVRKGNTYFLIDKAGKEHDLLSLDAWRAFAGADEKGLPSLSMNADNDVLVAESAKGLFVFDGRTKTFVQKYKFDHGKFATTDLTVKGKRIALMDGKNISILMPKVIWRPSPLMVRMMSSMVRRHTVMSSTPTGARFGLPQGVIWRTIGSIVQTSRLIPSWI